MVVEEVRAAAAVLNAATARLAKLAVQGDHATEWGDEDFNSCAHWLTVNTGLGIHACRDLLAAGHGVAPLPGVAREWQAGRLSLDKVRWLTRVATPADEETWVELALSTSGSQFTRICRGFEVAQEPGKILSPEEQVAKRSLDMFWEEDGMMRLRARLTAEDGALVRAAIDAVADRQPLPSLFADLRDPAEEPAAARRADALVDLCEHADADPAQRRIVIHVEETALGGSGGRARVDNGPRVDFQVAQGMACDAEVVRVSERDGLPIDVGRARRTVSDRMRTALQARDGGCRFPGCGARTRSLEAHHVVHWAQGGRTDLRNLVMLCRRHHHALHRGAFRFERIGRSFRVIGSHGRPIGEPLPVSKPPPPAAGDPTAEVYGGRWNIGYTIDVMCDQRHVQMLC